MSPEKLGSLIGAVFGLVFVVVNSGSAPTAVTVLLRVLGVLALLAVLAGVRRPDPSAAGPARTGGFGRGYWLVVVAEVLAIVVGLRLLNGPLDRPEAAVAWISSVVGAHFLALAVVWRNGLFHRLGAALLACGATGLVLAVLGAPVLAVDLVGGVLPGAVLLGVGIRGTSRRAAAASRQGVTGRR